MLSLTRVGNSGGSGTLWANLLTHKTETCLPVFDRCSVCSLRAGCSAKCIPNVNRKLWSFALKPAAQCCSGALCHPTPGSMPAILKAGKTRSESIL